ncbi:MAG TPA: cation transporter [Bacilli bacterium]|nr:cation transporter [Bacilli bacterium]HQA19542.1 cation transporter [Bacilli bacterium]HQD92415.1 cation transporter [Bacilli bacterium]
MKKVISIEGMSCKHCAMRVENSLKSLDEDAKVKVILKKNEAVFSSKNGIKDEQIKNAIEEVGYQVISIE